MISYRELNSNVQYVFLFSALQSLGRGVWMGNVLSAFIFYIAGESNTLLGYTSAATGLAMTLVVFPSGYLADKYRRDILLKISGIFGIAALIILFLSQTLFSILIALVLWGLFQGFNRPSIESILADSIESGSRSEIYANLHLVRQLAMSVGPFLNIGLFFILGDEWNLDDLKTVMTVGLVLSIVSIVFLYAMSDDASLKESEAIYDDPGLVDNTKGNMPNSTKIIFILLASNLLIGMGAGMTIKFFAIFFIEVYDAMPTLVNLLYGLTFVFTGTSSIVAQKLSKRRGRVYMIMLVQLTATACLVAISFYPILIVVSVLYILRGGLMNTSQPLSRSILMDVVPQRHRGKINSIEALAWGLFWNMSAAVGGYLIDSSGYAFTFRITSVVYFVATVPLILIAPLVKLERH
ncbi:MAG: MFS transporter [Candidatus Heimdallarchaeota archaeon]|nr:MFS transporter [Candidatus Heimdallarchaeota archaeon]